MQHSVVTVLAVALLLQHPERLPNKQPCLVCHRVHPAMLQPALNILMGAVPGGYGGGGEVGSSGDGGGDGDGGSGHAL